MFNDEFHLSVNMLNLASYLSIPLLGFTDNLQMRAFSNKSTVSISVTLMPSNSSTNP